MGEVSLKKMIRGVSESVSSAAAERKRLLKRRLELQRLKRIRRKTVPAYRHCKNCGTELKGMYCHRCGQYALDIRQPFWKYIMQYFENVYQFDSKVWVTLWMLFRRPGFLTTEFNAGKIASYVHPMKLLMFITVVFFIFIFFILGDVVDRSLESNSKTYAETLSEMSGKEYAAFAAAFPVKDTTVLLLARNQDISRYPELFEVLECRPAEYDGRQDVGGLPEDTLRVKMPSGLYVSFFEEYVTLDGETLSCDIHRDNAARSDRNELFKERFMNTASGYAPMVALLFTPVLGLLLMAFYRKLKMPYMSHLVFSLHWSSFMFLLVAAFVVAVELWHFEGWMSYLFMAILLIYTVVASHWVYAGTGWIKTALKSILLLSTYSFILLIVISGLLLLLVYSTKDLLDESAVTGL